MITRLGKSAGCPRRSGTTRIQDMGRCAGHGTCGVGSMACPRCGRCCTGSSATGRSQNRTSRIGNRMDTRTGGAAVGPPGTDHEFGDRFRRTPGGNGGPRISDRYACLLSVEMVKTARLMLENEPDPEKRWARLREINHELSRLRRGDHRGRVGPQMTRRLAKETGRGGGGGGPGEGNAKNAVRRLSGRLGNSGHDGEVW